MTALPHGFMVGRRYRNNAGSYEVLFIHFPLMDVRYEHGQLATLDFPSSYASRNGCKRVYGQSPHLKFRCRVQR
jgi:hypothetical protein